MFYGTLSSYIEFPNRGGLDTRFSITLMCWVQPVGQDGPLVHYRDWGVFMWILNGKLLYAISKRSSKQLLSEMVTEVVPAGKWVHVAASYDYNSGINSLYINGHLRASQNIGTGYEIATASQTVLMGSTGSKGKIAEMKVYDVALNESQIQTSIIHGNLKKKLCTFS